MGLETEVKQDDHNGDRNVLIVLHDGEQILEEYDYGEPEDNSFYRDWSWVVEALHDVYLRGRSDGYNDAMKAADKV